MFDYIERRRPMNFSEACKHAHELWGAAGVARVEYDMLPGYRFAVGTVGAEPGKRALGRGATWEAAFDAAKKAGLT